MNLKRYLPALIGFAVLACWRSAWSIEEDIYGEDALPAYIEPEKKPERPLVLPPYPDSDKLIQVDLKLRDFPFTFWIDPASLDVDEEGVIRYTAVLRSASGAENVVYEGIRCTRRQYRRYAYGAQGRFHLVGKSQWQFLRPVSQDRYRATLIDEYFCPLPSGDTRAQILRKLKTRYPDFH